MDIIFPTPGEPAERLIITVTADATNHVIVDITGAQDVASIRQRMFSKVILQLCQVPSSHTYANDALLFHSAAHC